ncbi:MAG TPA: helix-turn-helix domain-containing protein [Pseudonocardia sp.]|jgi:AcrR family transcriptional regulator|nr:helix-turn-helix domain-containing protein [Pseudonocardia sp.]
MSGVAASGHRGADQPRAASSGSNREQEILEAAARLFHERGFDRVGVDEIGQLAGISGPAIYRYFSGKDEILATLFDTAMDRLLLLFGQAPEDPAAALERLVAAHVEFAVRDRMLLSVYAREERSLAEPWRRRLQRRQLDHVGRWVGVLGRCFPDRSTAEHHAAAYAAIGMIHSVSGWPRQARDGVDLTRMLVGLVERGLGELRRAEPVVVRPSGRRASGRADNGC